MCFRDSRLLLISFGRSAGICAGRLLLAAVLRAAPQSQRPSNTPPRRSAHTRRRAHPIESHAGRAADAGRGLLPCVVHNELASCAAGATASHLPLAAQHPLANTHHRRRAHAHTSSTSGCYSPIQGSRLAVSVSQRRPGTQCSRRRSGTQSSLRTHSPTCLREPRTWRLDLLYFVGLCSIAVPPPVRQALHHRAPCRLLQCLFATREQGGSLFILLKGFVDRVGSSCSRTHGTLMLLFDREPCKQ